MAIDVNQAAERLNVSPARVRALIRAGTLEASRFGRSWNVDARSLEVLVARDRRAGWRSMSGRVAWAAAAITADENCTWLSTSELGRLQRRLALPVHEGAWQARMARRATAVRPGWVSPACRAALESDASVLVWDGRGVSRAERILGGRSLLWVRADDVATVTTRHAVLDADTPNVVLRVLPDRVTVGDLSGVPNLVAAADLMDEPDVRSRELGALLLTKTVAVADA